MDLASKKAKTFVVVEEAIHVEHHVVMESMKLEMNNDYCQRLNNLPSANSLPRF